MSVLGLIPARGGSKGIPRKNIRLLGGKPLIQWTVEAARASGVIDRLVVSTEDADIAMTADMLGVDVLERPAVLAQDDTPMVDVVRYALAHEPGEVMVLLQPTTPFRSPDRIGEAVNLLESTGADSVVSVVEVPAEFNPKWQFIVGNDEKRALVPWFNGPWLDKLPSRRQALAPSYVRDGGVYAFTRASFERHGTIYGKDCRALVVPSDEAVNINTESDWQEAERRLLVTA